MKGEYSESRSELAFKLWLIRETEFRYMFHYVIPGWTPEQSKNLEQAMSARLHRAEHHARYRGITNEQFWWWRQRHSRAFDEWLQLRSQVNVIEQREYLFALTHRANSDVMQRASTRYARQVARMQRRHEIQWSSVAEEGEMRTFDERPI